jgi:hypothetical protein
MEVKSLEDVRRVMASYDDHARQYRACPVEKRRLKLREERERQAREAREVRAQQQRAANISQEQGATIDARADARILAAMDRGGLILEVVAMAIADERGYMHRSARQDTRRNRKAAQ